MTYDEIYEQLQAEYDRVIADTLDRLKKEKPLTKKTLAKELFKANKAYWAARLALLDTDAVAEGDALAASLAMPYASAAVTYSDRVKNIYAGYQSAFDLSQKDAKELLKHVVYDRTIAENLKAVAEEMTDEEEKQRILAEISAPAYRYRLQRAEELTRQAKDVCDRIAGSEIEADRAFLQTQIEKAYNITVDEVLGKPPSEAILDEILPEPIQLRFNEMPKASEPVQEFSPTTDKGILDSFSVISDERVREIAGTDWSGREFSESVWNNTDDLAKEIKQVLIEGELTGASEGKMSEKIVERFGVAMHKARRVVRTEQNYCINQTELKGMLDAGYDEYEFASLGEEAEGVCDTCDDLDGMRFKIADAVVGVNCPPMHPFCRCKVTTPQQTEEDIQREIDERIDSWNIPDDMTFDEFVERVNNGELEEIRKEQDSTLNSAQESANSAEENSQMLSATMSGEENSLNMLTTDNSGDIIKPDEDVPRPANEPEYLKQFDVYDPSTRTDEEKLAQINPNYVAGRDSEWENNCQRCVIAYELVERGYDVTAKPFDANDPVESKMFTLIENASDLKYFNANHKGFSVSTCEQEIKNAFNQWGSNARAVVSVGWKGGGGHVFIAKEVDGKIVYLDPQSNKPRDIQATMALVDDKTHSYLFRIDNANFTDLINYAVQNRR